MTGIANAGALDNSQTLISSALADVFSGSRGGAFRPIIQEVPVDGNFLELPVVGSNPRLRKRIGPRPRSDLRAFAQVEKIETYDKTLSIDRKRHDHDPSGAIANAVANLVREIDSDIDDKFASAFMANTWKGYDGVALLGAHPFSNGSNNLINAALDLTSYNNAKIAQRKFADENGRPLGFGFGTRILFCGVDNEKKALEITGANRAVSVNSSGAFDAVSSVVGATTIENIFSGDAIIVVSEWITNGAWGVVDTSRGVLPFLYGVAKPLAQDDSDQRIYDTDEYDRGVKGDLAFAAGAWQTIAGYPGA